MCPVPNDILGRRVTSLSSANDCRTTASPFISITRYDKTARNHLAFVHVTCILGLLR
jgi:hypothetical protein